MRVALIALAIATAALAAGVQSGSAQHVSRYCTDGGGDNSSGLPDCSFDTWEQCRASASGLGRYCTENPDYVSRASGNPDRHPQHKSRKHHRD